MSTHSGNSVIVTSIQVIIITRQAAAFWITCSLCSSRPLTPPATHAVAVVELAADESMNKCPCCKLIMSYYVLNGMLNYSLTHSLTKLYGLEH